ncbi:hypothetical protein EBZ80_17415 [bacterium]|nr:hypothetical protein [bacterium]
MDLTRAAHLVLPRLGDRCLPAAVRFPAARVVSIVGWDKNAVVYNLDRSRFPAVERLNFLSSHPGGYQVLFRFFDKETEVGRQFRWGLPREHHRWFRDLRPERVTYLGRHMCQTIRAQAEESARVEAWKALQAQI